MKILRYRPVNKGCIVANFSLSSKGLIFNECTLFEKGGRRWVSFPSKLVEIKGEKKYFPYVQLEEKSHVEPFNKKVLDAIDIYVRDNPVQISQVPIEEPNHCQGELPF